MKKGYKFTASYSLIFAISVASFFLGSILSTVSSPLISGMMGTNIAMAQKAVADLASTTSDNSNSSNTMIFNKYENNEMGISIKYPSNFLIDESNSNQTVKQVSFFPAYDGSSDYPQTYISWFNVYVEELYPPISDNPINLSSYLKDEANYVQEQDADVTILETSTDFLLSGENAYKLVTRSYDGNSTVDDVEVGTIVGNKLYILSYEVDSQDSENAMPIANRMIYSFEIAHPSLANSIQKMVNSTSLSTIKEKVPELQGLLSSLNIKNLTENPYGLLNSLGLDNSTKNAIEGFIMNATQTMNQTSNHPSLNLSSLLQSGASILDPQKLCSNAMLSSLCTGDLFSHSPMTPFSSNVSSLEKLGNLFAMSKNSTGSGLNFSELKNLLGPFALLAGSDMSSPSPSSSLSTNSLSSFFANDSANSIFGPTNGSDAQFLNQLFSGNSSLSNGTSNNTESSVNPFEALFGNNQSGLSMFGSSNQSSNPLLKDNGTMDILKMLEFFQGGH